MAKCVFSSSITRCTYWFYAFSGLHLYIDIPYFWLNLQSMLISDSIMKMAWLDWATHIFSLRLDNHQYWPKTKDKKYFFLQIIWLKKRRKKFEGFLVSKEFVEQERVLRRGGHFPRRIHHLCNLLVAASHRWWTCCGCMAKYLALKRENIGKFAGKLIKWLNFGCISIQMILQRPEKNR